MHNRNLFLTVLEAGVQGQGPLPGCRLLLVSSHGERGWGDLRSLFYKCINHILEDSALKT